MTDLHHLQTTFQNYLLNGQKAIEQSIVASEKVSVTTRLGIYREAYQYRLMEALANNYPCIKTFLGEAFKKISILYIEAHPSTFRSIRWFGEAFPSFLKQSVLKEAAFLAELAELEWKMALAFDAADSDAFKMEQMATIAPESWGDMLIMPHPSLQRMNFFSNVVSIWQQLVAEDDVEALIQNTASSPWILWRTHYVTRYYALSGEEAWAIDRIICGATFGELCEGLCQFMDEQEVGMRAASFLKSWIQSGLLSGITIKT